MACFTCDHTRALDQTQWLLDPWLVMGPQPLPTFVPFSTVVGSAGSGVSTQRMDAQPHTAAKGKVAAVSLPGKREEGVRGTEVTERGKCLTVTSMPTWTMSHTEL